MSRSTSGICQTGKTRLDYADNSPVCKRLKSGHSAGNVEMTAIGPVGDCALVPTYLPQEIAADPCSVPVRKKVCDELC